MKLGIICNELFELPLSRKGGFGWAASLLAKTFREHPVCEVETVVILADPSQAGSADVTTEGTRLLVSRRGRIDFARRIRRERFDLLLCIDYRPSYLVVLLAAWRVPFLVWVRDPRTPADWERIGTLRLPDSYTPPGGVDRIDCRSFHTAAFLAALTGRRWAMAVTSPFLKEKIPETYGVRPRILEVLPNIIETREAKKPERPTALFLARLDPYKRPWLFVELACRFPAIDFVSLGQSYIEGPGKWRPRDIPANLKLLPHTGGEEKDKWLGESWFLINTSIHEGLAVSFLEALAAETPLISLVNPEDLVSRFGVAVPWVGGDGREALQGLEAAIRELMDGKRTSLGRAGRDWVMEHHSHSAFMSQWSRLRSLLGIPATLATVVIPTCNRVEWLQEAVSSVMAQTDSRWELIIVDDASTDGTDQWLASLDHPRIRFHRFDSGQERSIARNWGLSDVKTPFVLFLDDDDLLTPWALESLIPAIECSSACAVAGARQKFDNARTVTKIHHPRRSGRKFVWTELLWGWAIPSGQALYRTESVRRVGGYPATFNLAEDRVLWLEMAKREQFAYIGATVLEYRDHGQLDARPPELPRIRNEIYQRFIRSLSPSRRTWGRRVRKSAGLYEAAVREIRAKRPGRAAALMAAAIATAPSLLLSPLLRWPMCRELLGSTVACFRQRSDRRRAST